MSHLDASQPRAWTFESVQELIALAREGVPATTISLKMKRPLSDIHAKLAELGLSVPVDS